MSRRTRRADREDDDGRRGAASCGRRGLLRRHRPAEHRGQPGARHARARRRADLRVRHDRRQADAAAALDRRRRAGRDRGRGRARCRRCSPTGCRAAGSTSASSAPRRSTGAGTSTRRSSARTTQPTVRLPGAGGAPEIAALAARVTRDHPTVPAHVRRRARLQDARSARDGPGRDHRPRRPRRRCDGELVLTDAAPRRDRSTRRARRPAGSSAIADDAARDRAADRGRAGAAAGAARPHERRVHRRRRSHADRQDRGALAGVRPDDLAARSCGRSSSATGARSGGSTTSSSATPTMPARTTATSPAWPCCSPGCRRRCRARPSTGCAAPAWRP